MEQKQTNNLPKKITLPQAALELKKDKTYLFILDIEKTGINAKDATQIVDLLNNHGFHGMALLLKDASGLTVYEQELKEK